MKTYVLLILVLASSASAQECININPIVQQVETSFPAFKPNLPALKAGLEEVNGTLKFDYPISDILAGVLYAAKSGIQANEMTIPAKEFENLLTASMKKRDPADKGLGVAQDLVLGVVRNAEKVEIKRKPKGFNQSGVTELIFRTKGGKAIDIPTAEISRGLAGQNVSISDFRIKDGSKIVFRNLDTLPAAQKEIYNMVYADGDPTKGLKGWFIDKGMAAAVPNYLNSAYASTSKVHPAVIELSDIDVNLQLPGGLSATPREMAILPGIQGTPGVVLGMRSMGTYIPLTFEGKARIDEMAEKVGQKIQRPELAVSKPQLDKYRNLFSNALKNGKACGPDIQREESGTPSSPAEAN
jgi:hypothetical protein